MSTEKILKTRIISKHDSTENWNKAKNFIPKAGEIIIYDDNPQRIKVGDGKTSVINLPFTATTAVEKALEEAKNSGAFRGEKGPAGPQGPVGGKGPAGPQGPTGEKGAKGDPGTSITHEWKDTILSITSASGTSTMDLQGPQGKTGPVGPIGPAGPTGGVGPQGPVGPSGIYKGILPPENKEPVWLKPNGGTVIDIGKIEQELNNKIDKNELDKLLTGKASGEVIAVSDTAEAPHMVGCKVERINIRKIDDFSLNRDNNRTRNIYFDAIEPGEYTLIANLKNKTATGVYMQIVESDLERQMEADGINVVHIATTARDGRIYAFIPASDPSGVKVDVTDIMLIKGNVQSAPYAPHIPDLSAVKVRRCGKNVLDLTEFFKYGQYADGVTIEGGKVTCKTIPIERYGQPLILFDKPQIVSMTGKIKNITSIFATMYLKNGEKITGIIRENPEQSTNCIGVLADRISLDFSTNGKCVFEDFQIVVGNSVDPYTPFEKTEYTPSSDGTVSGMASLSPDMTILTNTPGAMLDVVYSRDPGKALDQAAAEITTLKVKNSQLEERVDANEAQTTYMAMMNDMPLEGQKNV